MAWGRLAYAITLAVLVAVVPALFAVVASGERATSGTVVVARVEGVITGATADYIRSAIDRAAEADGVLVVVLDTPGGYVDAALEIVKAIKESPVPVVGYVVGRWAVSAGTMILMCTHVAGMQPGTIIGAVQPVAFNPATGGYTPVNETKILNPLYKEMEACMSLRGRNETLAKKFVYENLVLEAGEALEAGAIEVVARSLPELLEKINGTVVETARGPVVLVTSPAEVVEYGMPMGLRVAQALSDPVISGLLSTIGIFIVLAALFSGHPHLIAVGVALILLSLFGAGYSASTLSVILLVTGIVLLVVELTMIPGFGAVGAAGIALIIIGLLIMPTGPEVTISPQYMQSVMTMVFATTVPIAGLLGVIVYKAVTTWRRKPVYTPSIVGKTGRALDDIAPDQEGFIIVEGEYWRARATKPVRRGQRVRIVGKEGPVVIVEPLEEGVGGAGGGQG